MVGENAAFIEGGGKLLHDGFHNGLTLKVQNSLTRCCLDLGWLGGGLNLVRVCQPSQERVIISRLHRFSPRYSYLKTLVLVGKFDHTHHAVIIAIVEVFIAWVTTSSSQARALGVVNICMQRLQASILTRDMLIRSVFMGKESRWKESMVKSNCSSGNVLCDGVAP